MAAITMTISRLLNLFCLLPLIYGEHPCEHQNVQELIKRSPVILKALGARIFADFSPDDLTEDNATGVTLITLTPETIYKGASILKVAPIADAGEYYEYEGQLNATVGPLGWLDRNILSLLPAQLIAFGKLENGQPDLLRINKDGLHKWSPQFESRIWKYLGWDDWSDFTLCSVTCGKGVQQRFRRCLLDTPASSTTYTPIDYSDLTGLKINEKSNNRSNKKYTAANKMKKRRKKKAKGLSTLSCEGYNIEQRNCNMFECRDDISDLLKFYKKFFTLNESTTTAAGAAGDTTAGGTGLTATAGTASPTAAATTTSVGGFQREWKNPMNFTLMTTLRAKVQPHATIFSLRNATHNLYLDQSQEGLKLFQERDGVTEMLPIKLDLYDNRWHQIAISVHNGDFITVYVDCLWTNSFVVSKRLFALPDGADVEVGRAFNGDLQQLLIIPGNYEKLQCSTVRTSINEVKRYIIDTFIDDDN